VAESRGQLLRRLRKRFVLDADDGQQLLRDLPHKLVLGLIADARLPPPRRDQQRRYAKGCVERCQRIDGVAETGILAHDHRVSPGEPGAGRDGNRFAFACPADIGERRTAEHAID
jgi:hypothetical protein